MPDLIENPPSIWTSNTLLSLSNGSLLLSRWLWVGLAFVLMAEVFLVAVTWQKDRQLLILSQGVWHCATDRIINIWMPVHMKFWAWSKTNPFMPSTQSWFQRLQCSLHPKSIQSTSIIHWNSVLQDHSSHTKLGNMGNKGNQCTDWYESPSRQIDMM